MKREPNTQYPRPNTPGRKTPTRPGRRIAFAVLVLVAATARSADIVIFDDKLHVDGNIGAWGPKMAAYREKHDLPVLNSYYDSREMYSANEVCLPFNAPLVFVTGVLTLR